MPGMPPPGMFPPPHMMPPGMPPPGMMHPGMPGMPPDGGDMLALPSQPGKDRTKKRRLKGFDTSSLAQLLTGLHQCLERLLEFAASATTDKDTAKPTEVPVQHLQEEFERHWRLGFDARAVGDPNTATFLRRFPGVFRVRSNGFQVMVSPAEDPNFEAAAEVGIERVEESDELKRDFAVSCAEQVAALLCK